MVKELVKDKATFEKDEKMRTASLTEEGGERVEEALREAGILEEGDLYDALNVTIVHHVNQSVRAHVLFTRTSTTSSATTRSSSSTSSPAA